MGLERFPIYFFSDEAIQTLQAARMAEHGFRDESGRLTVRPYFQNAEYWNLSVSVYAQVLPYELFGYSIFVTRATSALICLTGAAAVGLILRDIFKARAWWLAPMFLALTPAFFLHSRTAFETAIATSLYAWMLYFYLKYRCHNPRFYLPGDPVRRAYLLLVRFDPAGRGGQCGGLLRHRLAVPLAHRRLLLLGGAMLVLLVLPYLRFRLEHPDEVSNHLRILNSYWIQRDLGLDDKLRMFAREYTEGLSPGYWFGIRRTRTLVATS